MAHKARAATPYQVRILWGGFDGARHLGGLHVTMSPGWKTYWRVPGAGGVPPSIEAHGANVAAFAFDCPLPHRLAGPEGESIGYKEEVVFPFAVTPQDAAAPVTANLSAFIGVCETICIPVQTQARVELKPVAMATRDAAMLNMWRARVPQLAETGPVRTVTARNGNGGHFVDFALGLKVGDLFVEGSAQHFFNAPQFSADGLSARMAVDGAKSMAELQARELRVTIDQQGLGLEQRLRVG